MVSGFSGRVPAVAIGNRRNMHAAVLNRSRHEEGASGRDNGSARLIIRVL